MAKSNMKQKDTVSSESEAIAKMRAAADRHLSDRSENERQAWAEATARRYIKSGVIVIQECAR